MTNRRARTLAALAATLTVAGLPVALAADTPAPAAPATPESGTVALTYKTYRNWSLRLPSESFRPVGAGFAVGGTTFKAKLEGTALAVDTDGDGTFDAKVERDPSAPVATGTVKLQGKRKDGTSFTYAARVAEAGQGWTFAASGAVSGKIGATRVRVVDQNNNGRYDDVGEDALIVGRGDVATFLSEVVLVGGKLYTLAVQPDGSSMTFAPYEGDVGKLDLATEAQTRAKVRSLVLQSADKRFSFDAAGATGPIPVPAGSYTLHSGELVHGDNTLQIRTGRAKPLVVAKDATLTHSWGGPVRAEFAYQRAGDQIGFDPAAIWYFGKSGEQYTDWAPLGKSPVFKINDKTTGDEILEVKFPGST